MRSVQLVTAILSTVLLLPCLATRAEDQKLVSPIFQVPLHGLQKRDEKQRKGAETRWKERFQLAFSSQALILDDPWRMAKFLHDYESEQVTTALTDPDRLWAFVTSPETRWKDRHAAALKGGQTLPIDWLPKLMAARRALAREQNIHGWGMAQNPLWCAPIWSPKNRSTMTALKLELVRDVLGQKWEVPKTLFEYPLTEQGLARAPWPWHVAHALNSLLRSVAPSFDVNSGETWEAFGERCNRWYDECMKLPSNDADEIASFIEASKLPSHFMPMNMLARWYELALDPSKGQWYTIAIAIQDRVMGPRNSPNNAATARVFFEDILKHNTKAAHNAQITLWVNHLKNHKNDRVRAGYYNDNEVSRIRTALSDALESP